MNIRTFSWIPARMSTYAAAAILALSIASCKSPTEPTADQASDSEAAADLAATAMGTNSGGSGMVLLDAYTLANGGTITDAVVTKNDGPQSSDTATLHTATVTRSRSRGGISYNGTWTHSWTFFDANGVAMPKYIKGQTDRIEISSHGQHTITTSRLSIADSSQGAWTLNHLIASSGAPILEQGTLTRAGSITLHTPRNDGRQMTHTYTMNWSNDTLVRAADPDGDGYVTYLLGTGSSDLKAVNFKGNPFERQAQIQFNGDGTATLNVTRTSGDGKVDVFTVDVKRGIWLRDDHIN